MKKIPAYIREVTHSFENPRQATYFNIHDTSIIYSSSKALTPVNVTLKSFNPDKTLNGDSTYNITVKTHVCTDLTSSNKNWAIARCTIPNDNFISQSLKNYVGNEFIPESTVYTPEITPSKIEWMAGFNSSSATDLNPGDNIITINPSFDPNAIFGCTDPRAINYNPNATVDNGTCEIIYGCTNFFASNYNPDAGIDDGSCFFDDGDSSVITEISTQVIPIPKDATVYPIGSFIDLDGQPLLALFENSLYNADTGAQITDIRTVLKLIKDNDSGGAFIRFEDPEDNPNGRMGGTGGFNVDTTVWDHELGYGISTVDGLDHDLELRVTGPVRTTTTTTINSRFRRFQYCGVDEVSIVSILGDYHDKFAILKNYQGQFYWPEYNNAQFLTLEPGKGYIMVQDEDNAQVFSFRNSTNNVSITTPDSINFDQQHIIPLNQQITTGASTKLSIFSTFIDISSRSMENLILTSLYENSTATTPIPYADMISFVGEVKNYKGDQYIPVIPFDSIGNLVNGQGYQINWNLPGTYIDSPFATVDDLDAFLENAELRIFGNTLVNTTITFDTGWNFFGLPINQEVNPLTLFSAHADKIVQLRDPASGEIVSFAHDFNSIGNLIPGRMYIIKTTEEFSITI